MGGTYVFDLETDGLLDSLSKIHCMVVLCVRTRKVFRFSPNDIRSGLELISQADHLIAHNGIKFDYPAIRKIDPDLKLPKLTDTLVMSRLLYADMRDEDNKAKDILKDEYELPKKLFGRHSLASWGYRLGNYKGDFDGGDWQTYSKEMLDYCEQDTWVTLNLYEKFLQGDVPKRAMEIEHKFCEIIHRQEQHGWAFDEKKALDLYGVLVDKRQEIKDQMAELFPGWWQTLKTPKEYIFREYRADTKTALQKLIKPKIKSGEIEIPSLKAMNEEIVPGELRKKHTPFNPGSRQHIYKVFKEKYGWEPKEFTPGGEPKIDETVLNSLKYPEATVLSEYFLLDKRIGQLSEGKQAWLRLVTNGRIHGSVNTNGAVTGRCTHSHPNVAQVPAIGVKYGKECRDLFTTTPGYVLVGADASGLELRCLAHHMSHWDEGAYAEVLLEGDIHSVNQEAAGLPTRDNAKTFIYAFLYGAGDKKIGTIVGGGYKAGATLRERFLKTLPALGSLVKLAKGAAKKGYIRGLDGRKLKIRSDHAALNTLLQSAGAIVMKQALINADAELQKQGLIPGDDYEFVGNIHDEFQAEVKQGLEDQVGEVFVNAIRKAGEDFNFKCPLDGEYKTGDSWAATH